MPPVTWVLVANRESAEVRQVTQSPEAPFAVVQRLQNKAADEPAEPDHQPPGRINVRGGASTAYEPHEDPAHAVCRRFAAEIAEYLDGQRHAGKFERLVVVAPPKLLGALRESWPPALAKTVTHEAAHDFVELKPAALAERLHALLAAPIAGE